VGGVEVVEGGGRRESNEKEEIVLIGGQ
jgi:hypothetical protein